MRRLYLVLAAVALVAGLYKPVANFSGYCAAENRFFTEEELTPKMQRVVFDSYPPTHYRNSYSYIIKDPIRYASLEEFVASNKDCCRTVNASDRKFIPPSLLTRLRGYGAMSLRIRYKVEDNPSDGHSGFEEEFYTFTNCGQFWFKY
jgi:hypothetical protein